MKLQNLMSGISANDLRKLIVAHGETKQTDSGPQYVACRCLYCEAARKRIAELA